MNKLPNTDHWDEEDWKYFNGDPSACDLYSHKEEQVITPEEYAAYLEPISKSFDEAEKLEARILDKEIVCVKGPNKGKKYKVFKVETYPYIGGYVHIENLESDETHYLRANLFDKYFEKISK